MMPIRKLLSRIEWDKEFGAGNFEVGYYDRLEKAVVRVPFSGIIFEPGNKESFLAMDADGVSQRIPFHRIREVYKNRELIWRR